MLEWSTHFLSIAYTDVKIRIFVWLVIFDADTNQIAGYLLQLNVLVVVLLLSCFAQLSPEAFSILAIKKCLIFRKITFFTFIIFNILLKTAKICILILVPNILEIQSRASLTFMQNQHSKGSLNVVTNDTYVCNDL